MNAGRAVRRFDPGSPTSAPLNVAYRLGRIEELGLLRGDWLDLGCATGGYTLALLDRGVASAVGADTDPLRVAAARERDRDGRASFVEVGEGPLPFEEARFDGVLLNEVLEHVTDEMATLREVGRVLRPGGHLVLISPNRWFPFEGHGMHLGRRQFGHPAPLLPWLPSVISRHLVHARNYWPGELRGLVRDSGLSIARIDFIWPVFEVFPWLPAPLIARYRRVVGRLDRAPVVRRLGISTMVVARRPR